MPRLGAGQTFSIQTAVASRELRRVQLSGDGSTGLVAARCGGVDRANPVLCPGGVVDCPLVRGQWVATHTRSRVGRGEGTGHVEYRIRASGRVRCREVIAAGSATSLDYHGGDAAKGGGEGG